MADQQVLFLFCFLTAQILMDSARSCFSCLHGENYGSGTGYGISACEYTLAGCLAICLICNDASVLVDLKSTCCGGDQRVRGTSHSFRIASDGKKSLRKPRYTAEVLTSSTQRLRAAAIRAEFAAAV